MATFEIKARAADGTRRVWTRFQLDAAKGVANNAVRMMGFVNAQVFDVQGGHRRSVPLYIVVDEEKR